MKRRIKLQYTIIRLKGTVRGRDIDKAESAWWATLKANRSGSRGKKKEVWATARWPSRREDVEDVVDIHIL